MAMKNLPKILRALLLGRRFSNGQESSRWQIRKATETVVKDIFAAVQFTTCDLKVAPIPSRNSHRILFAGMAALIALQGFTAPSHAQSRKPVIAITQIVEHPELDNVRRGVLKALSDAGVTESTATITFESAQGDIATAVQIAKRYVGLEPDIIIPIGTPSAQAVVRATATIPVVFGGVADPLGAGIVTNMALPGANVTGVSSFTPVEPQLDLIRKIVPHAKRIGILSNPAEANSRAVVEAMVKAGTSRGYAFVQENVISSSEISSAASNLVGNVDVFYVPTDNTVVSGLEAVVKVARANKIPLFTALTDGANRGALAAAGFDWYQTGLETGRIAARILKGEKPGSIPVQLASGIIIRLNARTATEIGVTFPAELSGKNVETIQ